MTYEDLLVVPFKDKGRDTDGMDCYGLVLELCRRAGTPLPDIVYEGHAVRKEAMRDYVASLNVEERGWGEKGFVVQCLYNDMLHIGYMISKKRVLHMMEYGVRETPVELLNDVKYFEVIA